MRERLALLFAAAMALALAVAGGALASEERDVSESTGSSAENPDVALDLALEDLVAMQDGPSGAIVVVQRDQNRKVYSSGVGNLQDEAPPEVEDHMRLASASKAFSGAVALSLVEEDALSLDDTIGERLPELPEAWSEITLEQLLNHTSGLPDFTQSQNFSEALTNSLDQAPPPQELLAFVEDEPLNFEPGSQYEYSNSDNITVGLMIESVTGTTYEEQLQERVFGPLGLRETSLPRGAEISRPFIHGYDNDPSEQPPEDVSEAFAAGWAWAAGGMVSTPAELNSFIRGYAGGELFDARENPVRDRQLQVVEEANSDPPGPGKNSAGLGIFRYETRCGTMWGHTGNTAGYTQFMAASLDGNRSVTVSINQQLSPDAGSPEVFEKFRNVETLAACAALAQRPPDTGGPPLLLLAAAVLVAAGLVGFGAIGRRRRAG